MWHCKHCKNEFRFTRATDKANHSRHCIANPDKVESYKKLKETAKERHNAKYGNYKDFSVACKCCRNNFVVREREKLFPQKTEYYCSRNCANSIGGKAKSEKYGITGYGVIARKFYKAQCAVCGVTDILDVHHIDEDRSNFHPSNLIFLCPNDHFRFHRNKDKKVIEVIEGHGAAWGGHFTCNEDISGVQIPDAPPKYFLGQ